MREAISGEAISGEERNREWAFLSRQAPAPNQNSARAPARIKVGKAERSRESRIQHAPAARVAADQAAAGGEKALPAPTPVANPTAEPSETLAGKRRGEDRESGSGIGSRARS